MIIGTIHVDGERYLTKVKLTPRTRWGQLWFHIFHRGDEAQHLHDHPWNFSTMPLGRGYYEIIPCYARCWQGRGDYNGETTHNWVRPWMWHRRPAEYLHRVVMVSNKKRRIYTLMWARPKRRNWGFMVDGTWVHWKEYLK